MSKICQTHVKNISKISQKYPKLSIYIFISMDVSGFPGHRPRRALARSRRELDAPKIEPGRRYPKKTHARR